MLSSVVDNSSIKNNRRRNVRSDSRKAVQVAGFDKIGSPLMRDYP